MIQDTSIEKVIIYARQSEGKKKPIENQLILCREECEDYGWRILETFSEGMSASEGHYRKVWNEEVIPYIESGAADALVVWEASRISRDDEEWTSFVKLCRKTGIKVHVQQRSRTYDLTDYHDKNDLRRDGFNAVEESDLKRDRAKTGITGSVRRKRPAAGPVPLGYKRIRDEETGKLLEWVPDPVAAETVVKLFNGVAANAPMTKLAKRHKLWTSRIYRIIRSHVYIAERPYTIYKGPRKGQKAIGEGSWEPLVSRELWAKANRVLDSRTKGQPQALRRFLLSGVIQCEVCLEDPPEDAPVHMRGGSRTVKSEPVGRYSCYMGHMYLDAVEAEAAVEKALFEVLGNPETHHRIKEASESTSAEVQKLDEAIAKHEAKLAELKAEYQSDELELSDYKEFSEDRRLKLKDLKTKRAKLTAPESVESLVESFNTADWGLSPEVQRLLTRYEKMNLRARRQLIRDVLTVTARRAKRKGAYEPVADRLTIRPRV